MSFTSQCAAWTNKTANKIEAVAYNATVLVFSSVVFNTPVDTGTLRGGWKPSVDNGDYTLDYVRDISGATTVSAIQATVEAGKINYLTNSVEYGYVVEYGFYPNPPKKFTGKTLDGFSTQALVGMISPNILRWQSFVEEAVKLAS